MKTYLVTLIDKLSKVVNEYEKSQECEYEEFVEMQKNKGKIELAKDILLRMNLKGDVDEFIN